MRTHKPAEISALLDRYLLSLDADDLDTSWARGLFTDDAVVEFPMSRHEGVDDLAGFHSRALAVFESTQHLGSPAVVEFAGSTATLRANLISTHVHRRRTARGRTRLFTTGTFVTGEARLTAAGWRLSRLSFRLIWADGDPPERAAARPE